MRSQANSWRGYKLSRKPAALVGLACLAAAFVVALIVAAVCALQAPLIHIENVDGPRVYAQAWEGAIPIEIRCGEAKDIPTNGAPPLPWHFRLSDAASGKLLLSRTINDSSPRLYVEVRWTGVSYGSFRGSGGGAPDPNHRCH
jgi:hypothetical protein